jgi:hypothetical protein
MLSPKRPSFLVEVAVSSYPHGVYPVTWTTLGPYRDALEKKGISPNAASFVGEGTLAPTCSERTMCSRRRSS